MPRVPLALLVACAVLAASLAQAGVEVQPGASTHRLAVAAPGDVPLGPEPGPDGATEVGASNASATSHLGNDTLDGSDRTVLRLVNRAGEPLAVHLQFQDLDGGALCGSCSLVLVRNGTEAVQVRILNGTVQQSFGAALVLLASGPNSAAEVVVRATADPQGPSSAELRYAVRAAVEARPGTGLAEPSYRLLFG